MLCPELCFILILSLTYVGLMLDYTIFVWKTVEPEDCVIYVLHDYKMRDFFER